jgi:hypothetical protein
MNTDDKLLQILENSSCLSKGQMTGYLKHTLYPEELRAVELHLSSCALCNDALEGMETQLDVDKLLASMVPPVLPNIVVPKEKPKEKKEIPATAKSAETRPPLVVATAQHASEPDHKNEIHTNPFRPRRRWARPLGIAATLALLCGGIWYFKFNKENSERQIAEHMNQPAYAEPTQMDSEPQTVLQAVVLAQQDSLNKIAERKHSDSIYLARKEGQKLKAKADSLAVALAGIKGDSGKNIAAENQSIAASKTAEPDEKEQPEIAMKKVAAAPAISKAKEAKDDPTDYELGLQKYKQKNYASALLYFKSAESDKEDPKHWEAVYYSGLCNKLLNKDRKARKLFERVVDAGVPLKKSAQKQLDEMKKAANR